MRRRDAERIAAAVTVGPRLVERLEKGADPAEVVALADPYAPDAPLFALALADLPPLRAYFERLRDVRLEMSGSDLADLGLDESPRVGEILAELRRRKLNGELDGRDSELAAARELIARVIRWEDAPGPYEVAFSTREGGVSEGPYASLNLGRATADEPQRVDENRRRLCAEIGAEPDALAMNCQHHSADVLARAGRARGAQRRATASGPTSAGCRVLVLAADCLPIALARANGSEPALARAARGLAGLLEGIVAAGASALGGRARRGGRGRRSGRAATRSARTLRTRSARASASGSYRDGRLDLWTAAERALRAAGCVRVDRVDLCTACSPERFFSHRRDEGLTGQAGRDWPYRLTRSARNYERIRAELGPRVTIVAATKYVSVDELAAARRGRGRGRRREPRAGSRGQARPLRRGFPLALHRPPPEPQGEDGQLALRALPFPLERVGCASGSRFPPSSRSTSRARRRSRACRKPIWSGSSGSTRTCAV